MIFVNLKFNRRGVLPNTVVWTPSGFPFFRVTETVLSMPWLAPEGKTIGGVPVYNVAFPVLQKLEPPQIVRFFDV